MRTNMLTLIVTCVAASALHAEDLTQVPPMLAPRPNSFAMDADGRQYILGAFNELIDLNPGVGDATATQVASSSDLFILCLSADSGYLWSRTLGTSFGVSTTALTVSDGNVYIAGSLGNTNPVFENSRAGQTTLTATAGPFVLSLQASDGSLNTGFGTGGILNVPSLISISQIAAGTNLYLSGTLTVDGHTLDLIALDKSTGASLAGFAGFLSASSIANHNLALSGSTLYVAGTFSGTVSINGGTAVNSLGSNEGFIAAFNLADGTTNTGFSTDGIQTFGGTGDDRIQSFSVSDGKIYASGRFASTDAGIGAAGSITRAGTSPDAFIFALDTAGNAVASFDGDGVAVFANPSDLATGQAFCSAEFGVGVATPGIALVIQWSQPIVNGEVVLFDLDSSGTRRTGFGLNGQINFGGNGTETALGVERLNGRTALGARSNAFNQILSAPNLVERFLLDSRDIVAAFATDTGNPLFPYFTDVFPRAADIAGGSTISVMGNGFGPGSSLMIDTAPVTNVNIVNSQKFTATVPAGTAGEKGGSVTFMPSNRKIKFSSGISAVNYGAIFVYGNKAQSSGPVFQGSPSGGGASGGVYDADGNLYVCGFATPGAKDYDPSAAVAMHASVPGTASSFITRINANGSYGWTAFFDSLGGTQLNDLAVVGNRVYAVGHTTGNSNSNRACHAGINGLGNVRVKGGGDGVILVLDRATGTAVTAIDDDGIVVVGGSDDTFPNFDALHSITKVGTDTLIVGGRIAATNALIGASPTLANFGGQLANDEPVDQGAAVFNFDLDISARLRLVYGYEEVPPTSNIPSVKFEFSEDSSQLTVGVMSGSQVDLYQLDADLVAVPGFGIGGKISLIGPGPVIKFSLAVSEAQCYAAILSGNVNGGTIYNASTVTGVLGQPIVFLPIVDTPQPSIDNLVINLTGPNRDTLGVAVTTTGDFTCQRGAESRAIDSECINTLDANVVIFEENPADFDEFCDSAKVGKCSGIGRDEITVVVEKPNIGFVYIGGSGGPTFNLDTITFDTVSFDRFLVNRTGANPPRITSPLDVYLAPGEPLNYVITAVDFDDLGADIDGLEAWLSYDGNATLTGTPPGIGIYTCTIRADIPEVSDMRTLRIHVGQKPVINSSLNELVDIGEAFEYTSTVQGANGTVTINPGNGTGYTVTPTSSDKLSATFNTPGFYAFTVTATNQFGTTTGTLIVQAKYLKPKLQGPFEISALTTDRPKTVTISALGEPTINYTLVSVTFASDFDPVKAIIDVGGANKSANIITFAGNTLSIDSQYALTATVKIKATNGFGSDTRDYVVTVVLADGAPRITSPLQATAIIGQPFTYTVTAVGDPVIKSFIYLAFNSTGDTLSTSSFVLPTGAGDTIPYVLFAVNDKGTDVKTLIVDVLNIGGGGSPTDDSDGDGFTNSQDEDDDGDGIPDRTELGADTDPLDPKDFPSGADVVNISVGKFKATTVTVVSDGPNDSILDQVDETDVGIVQALSRAAKPAVVPGTLLYEFGGVVRLFTIDAKGQGISGNDKCTVKLKSKAGVVTASIKVSIKKADLKAALADEGFTDRTVKKETLTVGSFIAYNGTGINRTLTMEYTAKQGKKGAAKLKK